MITKDLGYEKEEGYIRYGASNGCYSPVNNIYTILDIISGNIYQYGSPTFAYQGSSKPFVVRFRDMQIGDSIRFVFEPYGYPLNSRTKLPVLSMTINGEEILLPSKIPQIEEFVYSPYADYQVTQNINNIEIPLFVRVDVHSNGNDILEGAYDGYSVYNPDIIYTIGIIYIDVKRAENKISEIIFNIDFDKVQLGTYIEIKYLDIKANGVSILDKNPIVKYWNNYNRTIRVLDKEGEMFGNSPFDWLFQVECDGYEPSDIIRKDLKIISIDGYHGDYNGGGSGGGLANYAYHNNDNYKTSEARILIPLTNTSFISYKK